MKIKFFRFLAPESALQGSLICLLVSIAFVFAGHSGVVSRKIITQDYTTGTDVPMFIGKEAIVAGYICYFFLFSSGCLLFYALFIC
jgi:hypothetical protein